MGIEEVVRKKDGTIIPKAQFEKESGYHGIRIYTPASTPSTLPSAGGVVEIEVNAGKLLSSCMLRINVTSASTVNVLVPMAFWLSETDGIKFQLDSAVVQTLLPLDIYAHNASMTDRSVYKALMRRMNQDRYYNENIPLQTDTVSRQFYLPLPGNFIEVVKPFIDELKQTLRVRISFNSSWVFSGTASNVTTTSVALICEEDILSEEAEQEERARWRNMRQRKYFSELTAMSTIQTLTASTAFDYQLSSFIGDYSHLFACIRGSTKTNASGNSYIFLELGTFENSGDIRLLDSGLNPIQAITNPNSEFLRYQAHAFFPNPHFFDEKAIYPLILTENIADALDGIFSKFYRFKGTEYVRFQPSASGTSETAYVATFTPEATTTGGSYQLSLFYRDHTYLTAPLAHDATAATIDAELELFQVPDILFAVAGTLFSAGTGGLTVTISGQNLEKDYARFAMGIQSIDLTETGGTDVMVALTETDGIPRDGGNATGSNLNLDVYGRKQVMIEFDKGRMVGGIRNV